MPHTDVISTSASIASTGLGIRYIGRHCYAYSGLHAATQGYVTHLSFTTGAGYIVGMIQLNGAVDDDNPTNGEESSCNIYFNDTSIALLKADPTGPALQNGPASVTQQVIIPPLTKVECIVDTGAAEVDRWSSVTLTGRVYGVE